jgi:hypothetical protein
MNKNFRYSHCVPDWYQRRFMTAGQGKYNYLDLKPDVTALSNTMLGVGMSLLARTWRERDGNYPLGAFTVCAGRITRRVLS